MPDSKHINQRKFNIKLSIFFITIGLFCFYIAYRATEIKELNTAEIIEFGDVITNIEYKQTKHSYILIKLKKYPDLDFRISVKTLTTTLADQLISYESEGDSIFIGIDKAEFRSKLIKVDSLSTMDTYFFNPNINIESIKSQKTNYLTLAENNISRTENKHLNSFIIAVIGLFFFLMALITLKKTPNLI